MPRSRSRSFESITRSATVSLSRKVPLWRSMASTSVVLPWSTWAMIAMLRILGFRSKTPQDCKLGLSTTLLWRRGSRAVGQIHIVILSEAKDLISPPQHNSRYFPFGCAQGQEDNSELSARDQ